MYTDVNVTRLFELSCHAIRYGKRTMSNFKIACVKVVTIRYYETFGFGEINNILRLAYRPIKLKLRFGCFCSM